MVTREQSVSERVLAERDRYVARGIAAASFVVDRAEGARVWDVDGRSYVDFAGGIACQNTGHGFEPVVAAIHEQADRYLHQCFMVGAYEPYVAVCKRLAELSPCGSGEQRSILVNSGAEGIENAVKIARAATGRPAVIVFENAFHGRTLLTMTMTAKLVYKKGFGPFAPEVYRAPGPYPYRGVSSEAALEALEDLFRSDVDPQSVACAVLEPVQGEGGFIPMPEDFPGRLQELLSSHGILYVDDEVQSGIGRTGPVWAIEHYGVKPDIVVSGKSLGGGLPLAGVTGRAGIMDAVHPGGLGGTFGGNPLSCAAALAVLDEVATPEFRARADAIGERIRTRLDAIAEKVTTVGEVRGLGPMLAIELVADRDTRQPGRRPRQACDRARARAGAHPPRVRHVRQRSATAATADRRRRGARRGAGHPGGRACRRKRRSRLARSSPRRSTPTSGSSPCARPSATSSPSTRSTSRSARGEFFTMLGPSGSGKTTTLRLIAGFEQPDAGRIPLGGVDVADKPPYERDVNTVFQDYALFPHMTVARERRVRAEGEGRSQGRPPSAGRGGARRWCACPSSARASRCSSPAASASASRSRARSSTSPACCCSTSRSARSTSSSARRCRSS